LCHSHKAKGVTNIINTIIWMTQLHLTLSLLWWQPVCLWIATLLNLSPLLHSCPASLPARPPPRPPAVGVGAGLQHAHQVQPPPGHSCARLGLQQQCSCGVTHAQHHMQQGGRRHTVCQQGPTLSRPTAAAAPPAARVLCRRCCVQQEPPLPALRQHQGGQVCSAGANHALLHVCSMQVSTAGCCGFLVCMCACLHHTAAHALLSGCV
jgi:hypothetical protein